MRIAIVLNSSWNVYNFRLGLLNAFYYDGHEIVVIAPEDAYSQKLVEAGFAFRHVKIEGSRANPFNELSLIYTLYKVYKEVSPDVVLHYTVKPNIYGTLAAAMLGVPSVNNVCGLGTVFLNQDLVSVMAKLLYRVAFHFPKKVFFQNADDYQLFVQKKLVNEKIADQVPGSGINLSHFQPAEDSTRPGGDFTFLMISRVIYDKGIIEYIEAVKKLKVQGIQARFQLLGGIDEGHARGISRQTVEEWIADGIIEYLGTTENVQPFIRNADCVVLPSYREGLPRTLLEAACLSKPAVTTDVPGCRDVVVDGVNGFLCKVKDAADLAEKMEWMYHLSREELLLMGQNGRKLVEEKYDEQLVIRKYLQAVYAIRAKLSNA